MHKRRGYTLVELMVVTSIIGILSTMAVSSVAKARTQARESKAAATMRQLANAYVAFSAKNGAYPHWGPGQRYSNVGRLWLDLTTKGYFPTAWGTFSPDPTTGYIYGPLQGYALEIPAYEQDPSGMRDTNNYFAIYVHPIGFQDGHLAVIVDPFTERTNPVPLSSPVDDITRYSLYYPQN